MTEAGHEALVAARTGLVIDPYFSASKIAWLLDHVDGARAKAEAGELAFGTVDCFLLWRLTGGGAHVTDATNASRTMLCDIHGPAWDAELLDLFKIPAAILPEIRDNAAQFGITKADILGRALPITGMAGDQHAATMGQACFEPGMNKSTYGTGCFAFLNTGADPIASANRLITTIAYRLGGETTYALEGSIFIAGAAIQWLRDELKLIAGAGDSEAMAAGLDGAGGTGGVYLVPAFTGLGAPYWDPEARGAITGLTRDTGADAIVRAALEAVCYQTHDLLAAMAADLSRPLSEIRVDGGMVGNDWLMQFLADILDLTVDRPVVTETTALGAAFLAGLGAGLYGSVAEIAQLWQSQQRFEPAMDTTARGALLDGWQKAVARVRL